MKISIFIFFLNLFIIGPLSAASFLSVGSGSSNYESDILDSEHNISKKRLMGDLLSFHYGHFLTNALSFELGYIESSLEEYKINNWSQEAKVKGFTVGFRYFSYEFFNIIMGMSKINYSSQVESTEALSEHKIKDREDTAPYYGVGIGLTFQKWQLFYDTRVFSLPGRESFNIYNWGLRVFF